MLKEKMTKIVWGAIIISFIILVIIGQTKIKKQNQVPTTVLPRQEIQKNNEIYQLNFEKQDYDGIVIRDFEILNNQKELDISKWMQSLESNSNYFQKRIDNYNDFTEFKENYNIENISELDFENSYMYILINLKNTFKLSWIEFLADGNIKGVLRTNYYSANNENQKATGKILLIPKEINFSLAIDEALEGYIYDVQEKYIFVQDNFGNSHKIYAKELINCRIRENMDLSLVTNIDYYKNAEIIRHITGEELKQELLLNLARTFNTAKLSTELTRLKRQKVYDGYTTFKVSFYDSNYKLFGYEKPELFNIELIANENTVLYARTNIVNIYNLQKSVRNKVFYLGIDEKTLSDERPFVTDFEIAE